ncbi:putative acetyltransferase [Gordonia effusa NBRC 100432]|uniref:Putative acetyltransferase n=1 Tax=Gordonia effusa NBRC 100432 TaxID=1077974 RepID=H0QYF9_9ACTN|nr:GNAT family N-acetyltransferase [Gordonia effusa]GAB17860.1 putative acetyltransferase [Gordonia effusa NBRC 100432]
MTSTSPLITVETRPVDDAGARTCLASYIAELRQRFPGGFDTNVSPTDLTPPQGMLFVAHVDDEARGIVGVRFIDDDSAEIKRMWVDPRARGIGLARRLLSAAEDYVAASGRTSVLLDTHASLTEAIALYRSSGYAQTTPYNDNPYAELWFRKTL